MIFCLIVRCYYISIVLKNFFVFRIVCGAQKASQNGCGTKRMKTKKTMKRMMSPQSRVVGRLRKARQTINVTISSPLGCSGRARGWELEALSEDVGHMIAPSSHKDCRQQSARHSSFSVVKVDPQN